VLRDPGGTRLHLAILFHFYTYLLLSERACTDLYLLPPMHLLPHRGRGSGCRPCCGQRNTRVIPPFTSWILKAETIERVARWACSASRTRPLP